MHVIIQRLEIYGLMGSLYQQAYTQVPAQWQAPPRLAVVVMCFKRGEACFHQQCVLSTLLSVGAEQCDGLGMRSCPLV